MGRFDDNRHHFCTDCGYDVRQISSPRCPECGTDRYLYLTLTDPSWHGRAKEALETAGLLAKAIDPGFGPNATNSELWVLMCNREKVEDCLATAGLEYPFERVNIVDPGEPICPACDERLDPENVSERCPKCSAFITWINVNDCLEMEDDD